MKAVALIPAFNEQERIAETVRAVAACSGVAEVIVIDDGSTDDTARRASDAGARVVSQPNAGKGAALRAGYTHADGDILVLIDGDLGPTGAVAESLLAPVLAGVADMTIACPPPGAPSGFGLVEGLARWGIRRLGGMQTVRPLSGQRALRREIVDRFGFADGFGVEAGLTIDALRAGYTVIEVPAVVRHAGTGRDLAGFAHRGTQGYHVVRVLISRLRRTPRHR